MNRSFTYDDSGAALAQTPLAHATAPMLPVANVVYGAFEAVCRAVAKAAAAAARQYKIRAAARAFSALKDHTLSDIGVHRSQIRGLARFAVDHPGVDPRKAVR